MSKYILMEDVWVIQEKEVMGQYSPNGEHIKEISGGYALTTNNRMELMA